MNGLPRITQPHTQWPHSNACLLCPVSGLLKAPVQGGNRAFLPSLELPQIVQLDS